MVHLLPVHAMGGTLGRRAAPGRLPRRSWIDAAAAAIVRAMTTAAATITAEAGVGHLLRHWRQRRRLSQLELALEARISARHLSFIETGRARPSREMVLHLSEQLRLPLRERNRLLLAAGFAPSFPQRPLDDPALAAAREAVGRILAGHMPCPALAVDRHWTLVAMNPAVSALLAGVSPALLAPPVNVLRLSLHPEGLAPRIANLPDWRAHLLARLGLQDLADLPVPPGRRRHGQGTRAPDPAAIAVPIELETDAGRLALFSTTTVFGTPLDVTLAELAIEAFYPADGETAERLRRMAG
jgi:transcriptional regulator with XRE-family HTH domain